MNTEDFEYVKESRMKKRNPVAKAVRTPQFKMRICESKHKAKKERFKNNYMDYCDEE